MRSLDFRLSQLRVEVLVVLQLQKFLCKSEKMCLGFLMDRGTLDAISFIIVRGRDLVIIDSCWVVDHELALEMSKGLLC